MVTDDTLPLPHPSGEGPSPDGTDDAQVPRPGLVGDAVLDGERDAAGVGGQVNVQTDWDLILVEILLVACLVGIVILIVR